MAPEPGHESERDGAHEELTSHTDAQFASNDDFWNEVEKVVSNQCDTHVHIDDALRSFLALLNDHREEHVPSEDELGHCAYLLYVSPLFEKHAAYIRHQLVYALLQDDDPNVLRITVAFLLADARENEETFELLNKEGVFPRLVELVKNPTEHEEVVHRMLMELMYEMSRIQRISTDDLSCIDDDCIKRLFDIIEQVSDDVDDPYHYPVIRVLLVLNEQFMVAAHDPTVLEKKTTPLTNKVVKILSSHGSSYKTFGANIILLLNREDETSLQLLTLKLMYLLFTTPPTYEYFYTNDLRVLVDILVRNLLDLPEYAAALRHTYLRVLYPLLEHTQLQFPPYYKRDEIRKLLALLTGDRIDDETGQWNHFEDVDETTRRLVHRCRTVSWLSDPDADELIQVESPTDEKSNSPDSPLSSTKPKIPPTLPAPRKLKKRDSSKASNLTIGGFLTPQIEGARHSSLSVVEMASHKEKPGVITPSRNPSLKVGLRQAMFANKERPPPPKARRSGFMRPKVQTHDTEADVVKVGLPVPRPRAQQHHTELDVLKVGLPSQELQELERNESEQFEDALETQRTNTSTDLELPEDLTPSTSVEVTAATIPEEIPVETQPPQPPNRQNKPTSPKKPPPAPKARRAWRGFRNKDSSSDLSKAEPGKFSANLPSITTTSTAGVESSPFSPTDAELQSPFSPKPAKTLAPDSPFSNGHAIPTIITTSSDNPTPESPTPPHEKRSISAALQDAQVIAEQEVQLSLEESTAQHQPHIPPTPETTFPTRTSSLPVHTAVTTDSIDAVILADRPAVLAPPGQAPTRGVPGPRIELERSPFLSEEELGSGEDEPI